MGASVPFAVGNAPMRSTRLTRNSPFRARHGAFFNRNRRLIASTKNGTAANVTPPPTEASEPTSHAGGYKFSFNLAFLFCAVVIKWPDEDISGYEQIWRGTSPPLAPLRRVPRAVARWMRWYL